MAIEGRLLQLGSLPCLAIALSCLLAAQVGAQPPALQVLTPGGDLVTQDAASGLDWLDVTATMGLSYQDISNGAGGWQAQGWRRATLSEMCDLFAQRFAISPGSDCGTLAPPPAVFVYREDISIAQANAFIDEFGEVYSLAPAGYPRARFSDGFFLDDDPADPKVGYASVAWEAFLFNFSSALAYRNLSATTDTTQPSGDLWATGHFLVRPRQPALPVSGLAGQLTLAAALGIAALRFMRCSR